MNLPVPNDIIEYPNGISLNINQCVLVLRFVAFKYVVLGGFTDLFTVWAVLSVFLSETTKVTYQHLLSPPPAALSVTPCWFFFSSPPAPHPVLIRQHDRSMLPCLREHFTLAAF